MLTAKELSITERLLITCVNKGRLGVSPYVLPGMKYRIEITGLKDRAQKINLVINQIANYFDLPAHLILSKSGKREIVKARGFCCFIFRRYFDMQLKLIASLFYEKFDHSAVIWAVNAIEKRISQPDSIYYRDLKNILYKIGLN